MDKLGGPFLLADEISFVIPRGGSVRLSKHHFKLLFILSGEAEHEIEGLDGRRSLGAGDILVAPVVGHHLYCNRDRQRAVTLQTIRIFLDATEPGAQTSGRTKRPEVDLGDFVRHHFTRVVQLSGGIDGEVMDLIHRFRRETETCRIGYRHRVRSICAELLVVVSRQLGRESLSGDSAPRETEKQIVGAAREFIFKHFAEDLTLGEIAWHVGKGEEHLARVFKRETGQSVFDYVRETRINQAKAFMMNPARSLTEIAASCGFHSLSFFSRTFRQQAGIAPSHYRQHIKTQRNRRKRSGSK